MFLCKFTGNYNGERLEMVIQSDWTSERVRALRRAIAAKAPGGKMSRHGFSDLIGCSERTIEGWESGMVLPAATKYTKKMERLEVKYA